jgi:hypothetical protein
MLPTAASKAPYNRPGMILAHSSVYHSYSSPFPHKKPWDLPPGKLIFPKVKKKMKI